MTEAEAADSPLTCVERQILKAFSAEHKDLAERLTLRLVQVSPGKKIEEVTLPKGASEQEVKNAEAMQQPVFTVGFLLLDAGMRPRQLNYLRIRDHMRRMGMARRAISRLLEEKIPTKLRIVEMPAEAVQRDDKASRALLHDLFRGVEVDLALKAD